MEAVKEKNKKVKLLTVLVILLSLGLIGCIVALSQVSDQKQASFEKGVHLQGELDRVMDDFTSVKIENQDLSSQMTEKDSLIMANAKEIQQLIATQADYSKIKKKLEILRKITQEYVQRIDSLVVANQTLTAENVQIKGEIQVERQKNTELVQVKDELQHKVEVAAVIKAYNFSAQTFRLRADSKEVPTDKSSRLSRINLSFTLSENSLVEKGSKSLYVRIARPDGVVLSLDQSDKYTFTLADGSSLQYSLVKEISYEGKAMDLKLFWDKKDKKEKAMDGKYDVMLYLDGKEIGRTSFIVRP